MAIYRVQAPDGSILRIEGPDDATQEQVMQAASAAFKQPEAAQPKQDTQEESGGVLSDIGRQVGLTARYGIEGLANTIGVITDPITGLMNSAGANAPTTSQMGTLLADAAGLPSPQGKLENIIASGTRAMAGAAPMVGIGNVLANASGPVTQAVGRGLAADAAGQVAAGAGAGGAGQAVQENGGGPGSQMAATVAGAILTPAAFKGVQRIQQIASTPTTNNKLIQDAARAKVPVMTSDAIRPDTYIGKTAQSFGEKIPFAGTSGPRQAQQLARVEAVKRLADDIGGDLSQLPDAAIAKSLQTKRAAEIGKYVDLKAGVFAKLDNAGPMPTANITTKLDSEIQRLSDLGTSGFNPLIGKLQDFRSAIQGKTINQVEILRKQLGDALGADEFSSMRSESEKVLRSSYGALKADIGDFIKTAATDRDVTKWKVADARLTNLIGELQSTAFKRALDKGDITPEVVNNLLFSRNKSDVQRLYKTLTPSGQSAARTAIIQKAIEKAGGIDQISPQRFANQLDKMSAQTSIFFSRDQKAQSDGLIRVINATQRASEAAANPLTGQMNMPILGYGLLADLFGTGGATTIAAGSIGGTARMYESAPVRNLLLKISQTKPGSDVEGSLVRRILPIIQQAKESNNDLDKP